MTFRLKGEANASNERRVILPTDGDEANQKGENINKVKEKNTRELKLANDFMCNNSKSIVLPLVKVTICLSDFKNIKPTKS